MATRKLAAVADAPKAPPAKVAGRKVHPAAAVWPMLVGDDLAALAADIKANGLDQPIARTESGLVLDGRNRLAACELAGVEPEFVIIPGDDERQLAYVLSANSHRRHMTKGQLAMAGWITLTSGGLFEINSSTRAAQMIGVSQSLVARAVIVSQFAPDLVESVISGGTPLDVAYGIAGDRKRAATEAEKSMEALRTKYPELVEQVTNGELTLAEALTVGRNRKTAQDQSEKDMADAFGRGVIIALTAVADLDATLDDIRKWGTNPTARQFMTSETLLKISDMYARAADRMPL